MNGEERQEKKQRGIPSPFTVIRLVRFGVSAVRTVGAVGGLFANPASAAIWVPVGLFILALIIILFATGAAPIPGGGGPTITPGPTLPPGLVAGCPTNGRISVPYGYNIPDYPNVENIGCGALPKCHNGIDIAAPLGTNIKATTNGTVTIISFNNLKGNYVEITNNSAGVVIRLEHLQEISMVQGMTVKKGDIVGKSGQTGAVTGPTLHYSIINIKGGFLNPFRYLSTSATLDPEALTSSDDLSFNNYAGRTPQAGTDNWGTCF